MPFRSLLISSTVAGSPTVAECGLVERSNWRIASTNFSVSTTLYHLPAALILPRAAGEAQSEAAVAKDPIKK